MIFDIADMTGHNPDKTGNRGIRAVSEGKVTWDEDQKAMCSAHRAMLCVSEDRKLWRCIACGNGCYREF